MFLRPLSLPITVTVNVIVLESHTPARRNSINDARSAPERRDMARSIPVNRPMQL